MNSIHLEMRKFAKSQGNINPYSLVRADSDNTHFFWLHRKERTYFCQGRHALIYSEHYFRLGLGVFGERVRVRVLTQADKVCRREMKCMPLDSFRGGGFRVNEIFAVYLPRQRVASPKVRLERPSFSPPPPSKSGGRTAEMQGKKARRSVCNLISVGDDFLESAHAV